MIIFQTEQKTLKEFWEKYWLLFEFHTFLNFIHVFCFYNFAVIILNYFLSQQDQDFNSTVGFDVLTKRTKDGREMCKDYEEFLKLR